MDINVLDGLDIELSDKEIVSLFANLLDNARESCERCRKNGGQAPLRIDISIKLLNKGPDPSGPLGTWLLIEVENSKSETEHMDVDDIKTSKSDKVNHGYGVAIICDIVRKYNGEIYMRDERDMFRTEIRIPL